MTTIATFVFLFSVIVGSAFLSLWLFQRQRTARALHPPESFSFLRAPGESLRRRLDALFEQFVLTIFLGSSGAMILLGVPAAVLWLFPSANPIILLGSGGALFFAGIIWGVRRSTRILAERAQARLGWIGERLVAESLEVCLAKGCRVFHDVPIEGEWGRANIDHVVISPWGVAVVETKMRSKPADKKAWENRVIYDGKKIIWPRHPNDTKTLWQSQKNAAWIEHFILDRCGISTQVKQVIAVPGWNVVERVLGQPRVVRGERAGEAVLQALDFKAETRFSQRQVECWVQALDQICRDVED